jgi:hypothetical protein
MKQFIFLVSLTVALAGCHPNGDAEMRKQLLGEWVLELQYPTGGKFKSTTEITQGGAYTCHIVAEGESNVLRTAELEGTFEIKNGVLIDTMTKHSNTNANLPSVSRGSIVRMNSQELVVRFEQQDGISYPTNNVIFRKIQK